MNPVPGESGLHSDVFLPFSSEGMHGFVHGDYVNCLCKSLRLSSVEKMTFICAVYLQIRYFPLGSNCNL